MPDPKDQYDGQGEDAGGGTAIDALEARVDELLGQLDQLPPEPAYQAPEAQGHAAPVASARTPSPHVAGAGHIEHARADDPDDGLSTDELLMAAAAELQAEIMNFTPDDARAEEEPPPAPSGPPDDTDQPDAIGEPGDMTEAGGGDVDAPEDVPDAGEAVVDADGPDSVEELDQLLAQMTAETMAEDGDGLIDDDVGAPEPAVAMDEPESAPASDEADDPDVAPEHESSSSSDDEDGAVEAPRATEPAPVGAPAPAASVEVAPDADRSAGPAAAVLRTLRLVCVGLGVRVRAIAAPLLAKIGRVLGERTERLDASMQQNLRFIAVFLMLNAIAVWIFLLVRSPAQPVPQAGDDRKTVVGAPAVSVD